MSYLTNELIDVSALTAGVLRPTDGACIVFEGVVRNHHLGRTVESIDYEAYRPMAEKEIDTVLRGVIAAHPAVAVGFLHRVGTLRVGETSIAIVCTSPHRSDAFAACRMAIDQVKVTVPIWKKERGPFGEEWTGWQK